MGVEDVENDTIGERKKVLPLGGELGKGLYTEFLTLLRNKVTHHSDHGSQNTSDPFREACEESDVTVSMGSVGDCYDNAMAESFFATLESELIDRQPHGRLASREQALSMIFDYLEGFYNPRRLHSSLGYLSPMEFERRHAEAK